MIRLRVLGPLELTDGAGREVRAVLAQPKRLALLAYLAVSARGFHRRDSLLAVFWPDLEEARGRDALNSAIRFLRRELGSQVIVGRGAEELGVDRDACWCDADEFRAFVGEGRYDGALHLYRGDLLPGFHPGVGNGFDQWMERERTRLRGDAATAAHAAATACERGGDLTAAAVFARRAVELSDADERVLRDLMELLDRLGDRAAAVVAYETFSRRLASEYDATPSPETRALAARVRGRQAIAGDRDEARGGPMPPGVEASTESQALGARAAIATENAASRTLANRSLARIGVVAGAVIVAASVVTTTFWRREQIRPLTVLETIVVSAAPELEVEPALSPDGEMVVYASGPLGAMRIFVRPVSGGAPVMLSGSIGGDHRWPRWSPDGRQILFVAKPAVSPPTGALYMVSALGGEPPVLLSASGERVMTPTWSADGKLIAYSDGNGILVRTLAGGPARRIVDEEAVHSPAFSPDGRFIAYVAGDLFGESVLNIAPSSIVVVAASGGAGRRLTDVIHSNRSPAWSADGRSVLYLSNVNGASDLHQQRLTRDGEPVGAPLRLTTGLGAATIAMSGDGSALVYSIVRRRSQIWSAPISSGDATSASEIALVTREAQAVEGLDLSRDGKWLVYDSDRSGNQDIYKMSVDGRDPVRLTSHPAPDFVPQWSPDGAEIAYYSVRTGNRDVRVMSADGRNDRAVTDDPADELYPAWSPDGRELVVQRIRGEGGSGQLVVFRRDSAQLWRYARSLPGTAGAQFPRWSPNGRWIAFVSEWSLKLVSPSGDSTRTLVVPNALGARVQFATWGADSTCVYAKTLEDDLDAAFWEVPLSGEPPRLLLRLTDPSHRARRQEFATDGRRLFFTLAADEGDLGLLKLER